MPLVSRNVATVPLTYPLTRAGVANNAPTLTANDSKRQPDGEHCIRLDWATP